MSGLDKSMTGFFKFIQRATLTGQNFLVRNLLFVKMRHSNTFLIVRYSKLLIQHGQNPR